MNDLTTTLETETGHGPLAMRDVDALIDAMDPGIPYVMPDLYKRYQRLAVFGGRVPSTKVALGRALKARGLIPSVYQHRRTWTRP